MIENMTSGGGVSFVFDDKNDVADVCHDTLTTIVVSDDDDDDDDDVEGNEDNNKVNEGEELFYDPQWVPLGIVNFHINLFYSCWI
jgi:hypothetical protein